MIATTATKTHTPQEVAVRLGISVAQIYNRINAGKIRTVMVRRRVGIGLTKKVIPEDELRRLISEQQPQTTEA